MTANQDRIPTPSMGDILKEEFMEPYNMSAYRLAQDIFVPTSRVQDILHNRRKITVDTSLRPAKLFNVSDDFFLKIQNDIDMRNAKIELQDQLNKIHCLEQ